MVTSDLIGGLIGEAAALQEEATKVCKPLQNRLEKTRQLLEDAMVEADTIESIRDYTLESDGATIGICPIRYSIFCCASSHAFPTN